MKLLTLLLLVLLIALQVQLWRGQGGLRTVAELEAAKQAQVAENERLAERNRALAAEVEDLKHGLGAVEERARSEMGMIKDGETFYQTVERPPAEAPGD